jgi:hypothetical protein
MVSACRSSLLDYANALHIRPEKINRAFLGRWLGKYALECVDYLLEDPEARLTFFKDDPGGDTITISTSVLQEFRSELKIIVVARSRKDIENISLKLAAKYS